MAVPVVTVGSETPTTIQLSWTSSGNEIDRYEVEWKRDTSGQCPIQDTGNATINYAYNSYTIKGIEANSSYFITVKAFNVYMNAKSVLVTGMTLTEGERLK